MVNDLIEDAISDIEMALGKVNDTKGKDNGDEQNLYYISMSLNSAWQTLMEICGHHNHNIK